MRGTLRCLAAATLSCAMGLVLSGCLSAEEKPVTLPPLSATPTPTKATASSTPSGTTTASDPAEQEKEIRAVYRGFVHAYNKAQRLPADRQREYLARWETGEMLAADLKDLRLAEKKHYRFVGRTVLHIMDVDIDGTTATVTDCLDRSGTYWEDSRTGRTITGTKGAPAVWAVTTLETTPDGWRVSKTTARDKTCNNG